MPSVSYRDLTIGITDLGAFRGDSVNDARSPASGGHRCVYRTMPISGCWSVIPKLMRAGRTIAARVPERSTSARLGVCATNPSRSRYRATLGDVEHKGGP